MENQIESILTGCISLEAANILVIVNDDEKSKRSPCYDHNIEYLKSVLTHKFNLIHNYVEISKASISLLNSHLVKFLINVSLKKSTKLTRKVTNNTNFTSNAKNLKEKNFTGKNNKQLSNSLFEMSCREKNN